MNVKPFQNCTALKSPLSSINVHSSINCKQLLECRNRANQETSSSGHRGNYLKLSDKMLLNETGNDQDADNEATSTVSITNTLVGTVTLVDPLATSDVQPTSDTLVAVVERSSSTIESIAFPSIPSQSTYQSIATISKNWGMPGFDPAGDQNGMDITSAKSGATLVNSLNSDSDVSTVVFSGTSTNTFHPIVTIIQPTVVSSSSINGFVEATHMPLTSASTIVNADGTPTPSTSAPTSTTASPNAGQNLLRPDSAAHREPSKSSSTTAVVGTIVPLVCILAGICIYFCWRRRERQRRRAEQDPEREAVWIAKNTGTAQHGSVGTTAQQSSGKKASAASTSTAVQQYPSKPKPSPLTVPKLRNDTSPSSNENRDIVAGGDLDDPFLTPTSQLTVPMCDRSYLESEELRASQIGLALTTPPGSQSEKLQHKRKISTISLADSVRTIIHHASQRFSNPFRDPNRSTEFVGSKDKNVRDALEENENATVSDQIHVQSKDREGEQERLKDEAEGISNPDNLSKSDTPPEELARRWIEILQMEAAQAQEASIEAARQARQLKRKEISNVDKGNNGCQKL